jgi:uncharacterized membrane protein YqiK
MDRRADQVSRVSNMEQKIGGSSRVANMESQVLENLANTEGRFTENSANTESQDMENLANTENWVMQDSGGGGQETGRWKRCCSKQKASSIYDP